MARDDDTRVIGYFAYTPPMHAICDGDACVIAGSFFNLTQVIINDESTRDEFLRII